VNSTSNDFHPGISNDELSLYFTSDRPGGVNDANPIPITELWVTQREGLDARWEQPLNLGRQINAFGYSSGVPNLTLTPIPYMVTLATWAIEQQMADSMRRIG
jgi:hypothetical protein